MAFSTRSPQLHKITDSTSATGGEEFERRWFRFGEPSPRTKAEDARRRRSAPKKAGQEGWKYLQVIKERDDAGRVTGTRKKAIFGEEERLLEIFEEHTAYVERTHLTMRQMNSRLVRKGLGFSKELPMHRAAAGWEDAVYNLTRTHKSLRIDRTGPLNGRPGRRWKRRTPAMAAGLTDQVWSTEKLLRTVPTTNT